MTVVVAADGFAAVVLGAVVVAVVLPRVLRHVVQRAFLGKARVLNALLSKNGAKTRTRSDYKL